MSEIDHSAAAEETKARLKRLGWTQERFADYLGLHKTTLTKWWVGGIPSYALRILEILEQYSVPPAWYPTVRKPGPTAEDARQAVFPAFAAVIDNAIAQGWSRQIIADAMRGIADDLDGRGPSRG